MTVARAVRDQFESPRFPWGVAARGVSALARCSTSGGEPKRRGCPPQGKPAGQGRICAIAVSNGLTVAPLRSAPFSLHCRKFGHLRGDPNWSRTALVKMLAAGDEDLGARHIGEVLRAQAEHHAGDILNRPHAIQGNTGNQRLVFR